MCHSDSLPYKYFDVSHKTLKVGQSDISSYRIYISDKHSGEKIQNNLLNIPGSLLQCNKDYTGTI